MHSAYAGISPSVRFHGQRLVDVLDGDGVREYTPGAPRTRVMSVTGLKLSSFVADADRLRRLWDFSLFCSLRTLDVTGNLISEIEPSALSGLTCLGELRIARNRLRSLKGMEVLAGTLRKLDASGNHLLTLCDGAVGKLELLEELNVAGNELKGLKDIAALKGLLQLSTLDMRVNPLTEGDHHHQEFAVYHIKSLENMDGVPNTAELRVAAHQRFGDMSREKLEEEVKKAGAGLKSSLDRATQEAEALRLENERLKEELRVRCQLLDTATHTATEARQELVELQQELAFLSIDSGESDDPETTDDRLQRLAASSSCAPLPLLPPPPYPPSLLSPPQASPPTPLPGSRKRTAPRSGDSMGNHTVGSAGREHTGSKRRESMLEEDEPQEPLTPFDLLASPIDGDVVDLRGGNFARRKPSPRHTLQTPIQVKLSIMEPDEGDQGPQSSETAGSPTLTACWMSPSRSQDAHGPTSRGAGEHVRKASGCGRGGVGDGGDMGGSTGGAGQSLAVEVSAAEVAEATQELSAQREVLRSQIEAKRSTLARVRQCLSVLSRQLAEARREAGDAEMGLLEGAELDRRGRASLLIEKRRHLQRLKKHMAGLESRLGGLKNTLSAKTVEFVTQNKQQPQGAGRAESPPYDPSMIELGKEVEVTSDEIASVASRLSRLTSEVEVLESHLSGSLPASYFHRRDQELNSPVRSANAPQTPSCDTSPSSPLGKGAWGLSLPQLEENGAVLRRFASESATEFVLRLRQRVRAAKVLEERLDGEIEAMQCEMEQAAQLLAQLERQALHHELAEARRDAKVSKHQAQALMQALHRRTAAGKDAQDVRLTLQEILTNPEVAQAWPNSRPARQPSPPKASSRGGHVVDEDRYESSGASLLNSHGSFKFSSSGGEERPGGNEASVGKHGVQNAQDRAAHVQRASVPHKPTPSTRNPRRRSSVSSRGTRSESSTYEAAISTFDGESFVDRSCFTEEGPTHRTAADMSLGPREVFEKLRAVERQLNEAIDVEEVDKATGMVVDRRTGVSVGRVDVCVLGIEGLGNNTARGRRRDAGALSVLITMDPVTACMGRTGAFGFGSYLFRASQPWGAQRFVIKPVLTKHASLRFIFPGGASSRSTAASERPIGEASVPLSCLDDQRPHILCLPLSQPEQIGSKRKAPASGSGTHSQHLNTPETSLAVRVRVRFTYSRVDVLRRRLNQLMSVVETRGYDLDQVEQGLSEVDVEEPDAPRRKGGAETTHEQRFSASEADLPPPPPPPMSPQSMPRQRHIPTHVPRVASQTSVRRRVHAQQQPLHAEREPCDSPQRSPPVAISGSLRRKIASRPRGTDIRHHADAGDDARVQGEGASAAADPERSVDGRMSFSRMSFSRAHSRASPGTPNVDIPRLGRRDSDGQTRAPPPAVHAEGGSHGRKKSAVAKQRSTPSRDIRDEYVEYSEEVEEGWCHRPRQDVEVSRENKENRPRVHKLNHADTSSDSIFGAIIHASQPDCPSQSHDGDSMVMHGTETWRPTHKRPRNCSPAKTVRQSKPVMEQLYDSLSRLQGVRREMMQHTGDATGGATDPLVSGGGGGVHAVCGQSVLRPAASECFDPGSPYHPDKRSPYQPSVALEQYAFPDQDQEVHPYDVIIAHSPTTGQCTPPVLVATRDQLDDRINDHHDNTPPSPAARHAPPPLTVAAAAAAMYDTHERLEVDDRSEPPSRHGPDLSIFRSPAMRRMEAMRNEGVVTRGGRSRGPGLILQQKSATMIPGRYIGAGVHEMKWREEMVGRLMEYP